MCTHLGCPFAVTGVVWMTDKRKPDWSDGLRTWRKSQGTRNGETLMPAFLAKGAIEVSWFCKGHSLFESLKFSLFSLHGYGGRG